MFETFMLKSRCCRASLLAVSMCLWAASAAAQQRPFEIDETFVPAPDYMQKLWKGSYDGMEPNSRMILSIRRQLVLNADQRYANDVWGYVKEQDADVLLRHEEGHYDYSTATQNITYHVASDSTLDVNLLLQGQQATYAVNHYDIDGTEKTNTEKAQFTKADTDNERKWVLFDAQLMSPVDPRMKAVYVMQGYVCDETPVVAAQMERQQMPDTFFDLKGIKARKEVGRGVVIGKGKKISARYAKDIIW